MRSRGWFAGVAVGVVLLASGCAPTAATPATGESLLRPTLSTKWLMWPPNDGCAGAEVADTLQPGTKIDRYGSEGGSFFAVPGTAYDQRALPYQQAGLAYTVYVVRQPLPVQECTIAPWFDEPGGGKQFKAAEPAYKLKAEGVIAPQ
jgi:Tuberculosis necrotizing toxin